MKRIFPYSLLTSLLFSACSYHPQLTLKRSIKHPEGIRYLQYTVQDLDNKLKREVLESTGIQTDSIRAILKQQDKKSLEAELKGNQYKTVVSFSFLSGRRIYSLRFYDDDNDGVFDHPRRKPKHSAEISDRIINNNQKN